MEVYTQECSGVVSPPITMASWQHSLRQTTNSVGHLKFIRD